MKAAVVKALRLLFVFAASVPERVAATVLTIKSAVLPVVKSIGLLGIIFSDGMIVVLMFCGSALMLLSNFLSGWTALIALAWCLLWWAERRTKKNRAPLEVNVHPESGMTYVRFSKNRIESTKQVSSWCNVYFDSDERVVGVETFPMPNVRGEVPRKAGTRGARKEGAE